MDRKLSKTQLIERSINKKYRDDIWSCFTKAVKDYELILEGDKIAVCISGGKDSMLMAKLLQMLQRYSNVNFSLKYIIMNPGYSENTIKKIEENIRLLDIPAQIFETDIFDVTQKIEKSPCYLCARMRRGHLYAKAKELGCNKIALGHHFDDVIETTLMGMLYGGQIQGMLPKLHSTNYEGMQLIRPLYCVREDTIKSWARYNSLDFIRCACKFTEKYENSAAPEEISARVKTKKIISELKKTNEKVEINIFNSIHCASVDTLINYKLDGEKHSFLERFHKGQ